MHATGTLTVDQANPASMLPSQNLAILSASANAIECHEEARSRRAVWLVAIAGLLVTAAGPPPASAIDIQIEYTNEGDSVPHDENPSWDPDGSILKAHFQRAKQIWEALLPGSGSYQLDFHWDDDISGLGLTTDLGALDVFVEINPNVSWFADPTPGDDVEFTLTGAQTLFNQLSGANQSTFFPGTAPPGTLEVGFRGTGIASFPSASGQSGVNASSGNDLLSTIVHELGHVLGIGADPLGEPGEFNIFPQHVGGLEDVLVLEDNDSGHLGGDGVVPFLMCEACGATGVRRFPSATDVLVVAEDQGITDVRLARVGSISSGLSSDTNRWIGGAVPNGNQDVYISHGGAVVFGADGNARDLLISAGNSVDVQGNRLNVDGTLTMTGATVNVGAGGTLAANNILQGVGTLTTAAGSLVRFNDFSTALPGAIAFSGSVGIGFNSPGASAATFSPLIGNTWTVAEQLSIGDENTTTTFVIDGAAQVTSGAGRIGADFNGGGEGIVQIDGLGSIWTINGPLDARNGLLDIINWGVLETGSVVLGHDDGEMRATVDGPTSGTGALSTWMVNGDVEVGPSSLIGSGQGGINVQNNGLMTISGDLFVHGTSTVKSFVTVKSNGKLDVAGDITIGPFGVVELLGSTLRADKLLPFLGTFTWTDGTLELTDQDVTLDSTLPAVPLAATTTLANSQTLILSGAGRDLVVGVSGAAQLNLMNSASVEVNDGDVIIADNVGSTGALRLLNPNTSGFVDGSLAVGGDLNGPGGSGQLVVAGDLTVVETLTFWATGSILVDSTGTLSADVLRRGGGGGLNANANGRIRFNSLQGFAPHIVMPGLSMVGIAEGETGQGTFVRNTGEEYTFREGWIIGDNARGHVDLINGGSASGDGFVHLGNRLGSSGAVLNVRGVDGFGSPSFLSAFSPDVESLIVGVADVATMNVTDQGRIVSRNATVARDKTASGSQALVNGQNSTWEVHGDLVVGDDANGRLTVENRGVVEIDRTLWIGGVRREGGVPGGGPSTPSVVTITGATSMGSAEKDTVVGFDLAGQLIVEARGEMHTGESAYIAYEPSSHDSAAVVSTQGTWRVGQDLSVGHKAPGALEIQTEANVTVGGNPMVGGGNVHIARLADSGGSMAEVVGSGVWQIERDLYVGDQDDGGLAVDSKSQVIVGDDATIANQSTAGGSWATVSGDAGWEVGADLRVGHLAQGSLQVDANGLVTVAGNAYLGGGGPSGNGLITLIGNDDSVATLKVQGDLFIGGDNVGGVGKGKLAMQGETLVGANRVVNWPEGELVLAGEIDVGANSVENFGLLTGRGTIDGELMNHDDVAPGGVNVADSIEVAGDFRQFASGALHTELALTDFDQLLFSGNAMFDGGGLFVSLLDGFMPSLGDQFQIFSYAGAVSGPGFAAIGVPALSPGLTWETGNLLTTGILEVVPLLPGDFDFDGDVDGADFLLWQQGGSYTPLSPADLAAWQTNFGIVAGPIVAAGTSAPEPSTALMLMFGIAASITACRTAHSTSVRKQASVRTRKRPSSGFTIFS